MPGGFRFTGFLVPEDVPVGVFDQGRFTTARQRRNLHPMADHRRHDHQR